MRITFVALETRFLSARRQRSGNSSLQFHDRILIDQGKAFRLAGMDDSVFEHQYSLDNFCKNVFLAGTRAALFMHLTLVSCRPDQKKGMYLSYGMIVTALS